MTQFSLSFVCFSDWIKSLQTLQNLLHYVVMDCLFSRRGFYLLSLFLSAGKLPHLSIHLLPASWGKVELLLHTIIYTLSHSLHCPCSPTSNPSTSLHGFYYLLSKKSLPPKNENSVIIKTFFVKLLDKFDHFDSFSVPRFSYQFNKKIRSVTVSSYYILCQ